MKLINNFINEGNQAHKMVEFAKKYYKNWESDLKQIRIKFEKSINDKELMKNDFDKYLDNQFKAMDEFNNKTVELVDKPEVAISALLYHISFLKSTQTNLFKYGIQAIKHLIELKKNNNYEGDINKYIYDLCNHTIKNTQKTVNDLNQTIKDIKNEDIHSLHNIFNDEFLKSFVDKYKLIGIKYTDKFEIYDEKMILNLFKKKYKEFINNQKIKEHKMTSLKEFILESLHGNNDKEPIYLMVKDNHFVINYNEDGFGDDNIDPKYKFVLVLGDEYTYHIKSTSNVFTSSSIKPEYLHGGDDDWDLPELIFGTTRKSLEKCVEKIEDDRSFQNYGGEISGTIFELKDVKTKINIWDAANI